MSTERIKTIDGKELLNLEIEPIKFVVDGLIPQGLHILAGAPKTGKSWLLLLLCLKISKGEPIWNLTTEKGTVLYLCLEDSTSRIQDRLFELTDEAPENLHFATSAHSLTDGLANQIELFINEHPDTKRWEFVSTDSPQTDRFRSDNVLSLLLSFMKEQKEFSGTATELAQKLGGNIKPNVLTRKLSKFKNELSKIGIEFEKSRSGERRELLLIYEPRASNDDMTVNSFA